jgi:hypothetical protein
MALGIAAPGAGGDHKVTVRGVWQHVFDWYSNGDGLPEVETESSPFVRPNNGLLTHAVEADDSAEFVRKLSKSTWFCELAEA